MNSGSETVQLRPRCNGAVALGGPEKKEEQKNEGPM